MLYYLLHSIDIFSDTLFLQAVTVRLLKSKKSLTNAFKLIVGIPQ